MSISSILNIAKNALSANQIAVQVTSHNISNVNTKGYARQTPVFEEESASSVGGILIGNGVKVDSVIRYYDRYIEKQLAGKNNELQEQTIYSQYFERIEGILNEDSTKLTSSITAFFNAWQELSADPESTAVREGILAAATNMSRSINNIYNGLKGIQIELNNKLKLEIDDINTITSAIADLNNMIYKRSGLTSEANDYLNRRTEYIKELSGKLDITYFEDDFGRVTILTSKGKPLVDGGQSWQLTVTDNEDTGFYNLGWKDPSGNITDITNNITGGRVRGLIEMRDGQINDFIYSMDELARAIIEEVNTIHKKGYTLNHNTSSTDPDNIAFFNEITGNYSKDMAVSDKVKADIKNIAAASKIDSTSGKPIGNGIALNIASLIDQNILEGGKSNIVDFTSSITNRVGQLSKSAKNFLEYSEDTMQIMEKQRESVSGVSLDEEMANLIKFQYAFQAASRLFTVADELFQSILEAV
ncbi:MAG: flagellar hook-associated protein FlgK [Syntrophorhabdaceae bacterium]|nr:flagellar hook-associated protein FlgK [Syntrophorhabdaceae bacterium]